MTGLVSISFRGCSPEEIVSLVKAAGLEAIEWGGDVHVPQGNTETALRVAKVTSSQGLAMPEYGSYYHIACDPAENFVGALQCAHVLGCPAIRVWAGTKNRQNTGQEEYQRCVEDARRICELSGKQKVVLECHCGTLTEDFTSAVRFLEDVECENFGMMWQPNQFRSFEYNLEAIRALLPWIHGVHTFSWQQQEKLPLHAMEKEWLSYMDELDKAAAPPHYLLEFMPDGKPETLAQEAATLTKWRKGRL